MPIPDTQLIESIVRPLAEKYVRECCPSETPYLPLIIEHLLKHYSAHQRGRPVNTVAQLPLAGGLPFDGEESVKLITPAAFLIIEGSVQQLRHIPKVPSLTEIQMVLKETARKTGASESLAIGLAEVVGVELRTRLLELQENRKEHPNPTADESQLSGQPWVPSRFTVSSLVNGHYSPPRRREVGWVKRLLHRYDYDIVVNEIEHTLTIGGAEPRPISPIRRMQRGMLWLVLTHIEERAITHDDINQAFGMGIHVWGVDNRRTIYQYPVELKKLVGEFADKMLQEGANHAYAVSRYGWSFFWVLSSRNPHESELHPGPPRKAAENQ